MLSAPIKEHSTLRKIGRFSALAVLDIRLVRLVRPVLAGTITALLACAALAAGAYADAPTITSATWAPSNAGYSYNGVLTVQWTLPADAGCNSGIVIGDSPAVGANGELQDRSGGGQAVGGCESPDSGEVYANLTPGTWYVQVVADNTFPPPCTLESPCFDYSNVVAFTVPSGSGTSGSGTSGTGTSGTGTSGSGTSGGGTSGSCITTATCVIPLNYSGVVRGQPYVAHADGSQTPFRDMTSLKSGDWIRTGSNGVARWGMGYSNGVGLACAMWAGPNSSLGFTTLLISAQGIFFMTAVLSNGEVVVEQSVIDLTLRTPNAIVKAARVAKASGAHAAAAGATFTVQKTGSSSLVQVYGGSVMVSNAHGKHTVVVKAGFESSVKGSGPPSRARRFKVPKHRFWH